MTSKEKAYIIFKEQVKQLKRDVNEMTILQCGWEQTKRMARELLVEARDGAYHTIANRDILPEQKYLINLIVKIEKLELEGEFL